MVARIIISFLVGVITKTEAANSILWREKDATKNSISMAARTVYIHKELFKKNGNEMQAMLLAKDINWNSYPPFFKRGTFIQEKTIEHKFTADELEELPAKHEARLNPDMVYSKTVISEVIMPPFGHVTNREEVIFDRKEPLYEV